VAVIEHEQTPRMLGVGGSKWAAECGRCGRRSAGEREYAAWEKVDVRVDTAGRTIDESCATLARALASL
jgi:hypothetical protein